MRDRNRLIVRQRLLPRRLGLLGDAREPPQLFGAGHGSRIPAIVVEPGQAARGCSPCAVGGSVGGRSPVIAIHWVVFSSDTKQRLPCS